MDLKQTFLVHGEFISRFFMKKIFILLISILIFSSAVFADTNNTVSIDDEVYSVIMSCENKGLCSPVRASRPWTEKYILSKLNESLESLTDSNDDRNSFSYKTILSVLKYQISRFERTEGLDIKNLSFRYENKDEEAPITFNFNDSLDGNFGTGIYEKARTNALSYEFYNNFNFFGNFGKSLSYGVNAFVGFAEMPLENMGSYTVIDKYIEPSHDINEKITTYKNNAYTPYSYTKKWDGSAYDLEDLGANGLRGWPFGKSLVFGMKGEISASLLKDHVEIVYGRNLREWGGMDEGASLSLNSQARPFMAIETKFHLFDWLSLSTLTGSLEMPNQEFINGIAEDGDHFQNNFSLSLVELNFKYVHFDFGSGTIWPKRSELGYLFPLIDNVVYQNNIGDRDNLSFSGNLKFRYPGIGSVWLSGYIDELSYFKLNVFTKMRNMTAYQAGAKFELPFLPFGNISFRYTKVNSYCYTHPSLNTGWYAYGNYTGNTTALCTSYTNNGYSLGYYLPPNSDEFLIKASTLVNQWTNIFLQYQLIRHGVDFGDKQLKGGSLYSELWYDHSNLEKPKKFLKDGCYEWTNVVSAGTDVNCRQFFGVPATLNFKASVLFTHYTDTGLNPGEIASSYSKIETEDYAKYAGFLVSLGVKMFVK